MSHKTYMADYFKDNYSHQASVIDVCATIELLFFTNKGKLYKLRVYELT